MEMSPPLHMKSSSPVNIFGRCASCSLVLCSASRPQLLPCLHSLCKHCITMPGESKECPICWEKYELQQVTSNFLFAEQPTSPDFKCGGCEDLSVFGWCVDCGDTLCSECVEAHKRVKTARNHYIHTITPEFPRPVLCPVHKKEVVNSFCLTCDQLTCKLCRPSHPKHLLQYSDEVLSRQKKQIQRTAQEVQQKRQTVQKSLTHLDKRLCSLEDLCAGLRLQMKETVLRLCNLIVRKAAKLNREIKDLCVKEREKLSERRTLLQRLEEKLDHVLSFTDKAVTSPNHTVLLSCKTQIHRQLQRLLGEVVPPTMMVLDLSFHSNEENIKKELKTLGRIEAEQVPFLFTNTGTVPHPSPDPASNHSLNTPTPTSTKPPQCTTTTSLSSPPSVSHPQQSPKSSNTLCALFRKSSSLQTHHKNNKYTNLPSLKRAWSYHPYCPRTDPKLVQSSVKSVSPLNQSKTPKATPVEFTRSSSVLQTSGPVSSLPVRQTVTKLMTSSSTQTSSKQNSNVPVGGHIQNTSVCRSAPHGGRRRNKAEVKPTFTGPEASTKHPSANKGKVFNRLNWVKYRQINRSQPKQSSSHQRNPLYTSGDAPQEDSVVINSPGFATVTPFLVVNSYYSGNNGMPAVFDPFAVLSPELTSVQNPHLTSPDLYSLSGRHLNLSEVKPKVSEDGKQKHEVKHEQDHNDNHMMTIKTEIQDPQTGDDEDVKPVPKITDGQGNLVVLEPLGRWREESSSFQISVVKKDEQCRSPVPVFTPSSSSSSRPLLASEQHCTACRLRGGLIQCCVCQRAFHTHCHIPPISTTDVEKWQCLLCCDLSHSEDLHCYPKSDEPPFLSWTDQKKCEYLLLSLSCKKQSSVLFMPVKLSSQTQQYMDVTLIRGRLLGKLTPPYHTSEEFVSDVWLLLNTLLNSSKEVEQVKRLHKFFFKEVMRVFGPHPSFLQNHLTGKRDE